MKHVLLIGGTDSSGGAGLFRDAAVVDEHGLRVRTVVTAVTAQSNARVGRVHLIPEKIIAAQLAAAFADTPPGAIKIGMLGSEAIVNTVARALNPWRIPIVLDPVLKASSGGTLLDAGGVAALKKSLMLQAALVTPNLIEAAALTGSRRLFTAFKTAEQARLLQSLGAQAVLIKGGHATGDICVDHLFCATGSHQFSAKRLHHSPRGTGCTLATAIACQLAMGLPLASACGLAQQYTHNWIATKGAAEPPAAPATHTLQGN